MMDFAMGCAVQWEPFDSHAANPIREVGAIDPVAVTEQIPGCRVVGERFHDLLGCPARRRMTCDVEVNDRPSMMPENHKADEDAEVQGYHCEEVDRRDLAGMVLQEDAGLSKSP